MDIDRKMSLGKRVAQAREAKNLTQGELAKLVGIRQQSIGEIEAGDIRAPRKIDRIADILGVSKAWLQYGYEEGITYSLKIKTADWENLDNRSFKSAQFPDNYFSLIVDDDSMENNVDSRPTFPKGTIIIVDPSKQAEPGKCVIARPKGSPDARPIFRLLTTDYIKKALIPLNVSRFYEPYSADQFDIIGVVVASMNLDL